MQGCSAPPFIGEETGLFQGHTAGNWVRAGLGSWSGWHWSSSLSVLSAFFFHPCPSLHSFCPLQTSPEELPCPGILPLPQNRTTAVKPKPQIFECQRRNAVSSGEKLPPPLSWEYVCNPRLCCLVGMRNDNLTWEWKTVYKGGFLSETNDSVKCWSLGLGCENSPAFSYCFLSLNLSLLGVPAHLIDVDGQNKSGRGQELLGTDSVNSFSLSLRLGFVRHCSLWNCR